MEEKLLEKYPAKKRYTLAILQEFQRECGYISAENLRHIAAYLEIPLAEVFAMATFYKALSLEKKGKFIIKVCDGTACHIKGSASVLDEIKEALGIDAGEVTPDGLFSLETVNCLGCCAMAPVVVCGEEYLGNATKKTVQSLVGKYKEAGGDE